MLLIGNAIIDFSSDNYIGTTCDIYWESLCGFVRGLSHSNHSRIPCWFLGGFL